MCGFYGIAFIEYMVTGKTLLDYTNLFPPNNYKKNDKIIYKYFQDKYGSCICSISLFSVQSLQELKSINQL